MEFIFICSFLHGLYIIAFSFVPYFSSKCMAYINRYSSYTPFVKGGAVGVCFCTTLTPGIDTDKRSSSQHTFASAPLSPQQTMVIGYYYKNHLSL